MSGETPSLDTVPTYKHPELKVSHYYKWNGMLYKAKTKIPQPSFILVPVEFEQCGVDYLPAGSVCCIPGTKRTAENLKEVNDAPDKK